MQWPVDIAYLLIHFPIPKITTHKFDMNDRPAYFWNNFNLSKILALSPIRKVFLSCNIRSIFSYNK